MRILKSLFGAAILAIVFLAAEEPVKAEWFFCGASICDITYNQEPVCHTSTDTYEWQMRVSLILGEYGDYANVVSTILSSNEPYAWVPSFGDYYVDIWYHEWGAGCS